MPSFLLVFLLLKESGCQSQLQKQYFSFFCQYLLVITDRKIYGLQNTQIVGLNMPESQKGVLSFHWPAWAQSNKSRFNENDLSIHQSDILTMYIIYQGCTFECNTHSMLYIYLFNVSCLKLPQSLNSCQRAIAETAKSQFCLL